MLKLFRILTLLLIILFSANFLIASNENTIDNNRYLYGLFKNFYFKDIDSFQANEIDIQEAFTQLYLYDKFDLNFKIHLYSYFFKNYPALSNSSLANEDLIILVVNALKYDVFSEYKIYMNDFEFFKSNMLKFTIESYKNNCKIVFVKDREEMIKKQTLDTVYKFNYIPKECYDEVVKTIGN